MQGTEFEPSDDQRRTVRAMSGFGIPQPDIATHLEIDPKTLRKHFRRELDRGVTEANTKVAQSLFNMATQGNNVAAAIFWMKARAGWREKHDVTLSPGEGVPMPVIYLPHNGRQSLPPGFDVEASALALPDGD